MAVAKTLKVLKLMTFISLIFISITSIMQTLPKHKNIGDYTYRVREGRDLTAGDYPYVVSLTVIFEEMKFFVRFCTGSMISETWGISAGHCVDGKLLKNTFVVYNNFTESPLHTGLYVPVIEMIRHSSYKGIQLGGEVKRQYNDIGLFKSGNVPVKTYAALSAVDYSTIRVGLPVVYVGGGRMQRDLKETAALTEMTKSLKLGNAIIIKCDPDMRGLSKHSVCIAPKGSNRLQATMQGDSGGPLIYDGKIIGVHSWITPKEFVKHYTYTPLSPFLDWIHSVMNIKKL